MFFVAWLGGGGPRPKRETETRYCKEAVLTEPLEYFGAASWKTASYVDQHATICRESRVESPLLVLQAWHSTSCKIAT